jgi:excisionase family DNA binding protein
MGQREAYAVLERMHSFEGLGEGEMLLHQQGVAVPNSRERGRAGAVVGRLLRPMEVAVILQVALPRVYKWIQDGSLRSARFGRSVRVPESAVAEFVEARTEGGYR